MSPPFGLQPVPGVFHHHQLYRDTGGAQPVIQDLRLLGRNHAILYALQNQERRVIRGNVSHRAVLVQQRIGIAGRSEDLLANRLLPVLEQCQQVGWAVHVDHRLDAAGLIGVFARIPAGAGVGRPEQRDQVPTGAAAHCPDVLRVQVVACGVGAQMADGAFHVLDLGREECIWAPGDS